MKGPATATAAAGSDMGSIRSVVAHLPLFIGGFMGPFGTVVIVPMFPELRTEFNASPEAVGLGFSLYLIPFALLLLVSGTLGERWGRRRTVRATYLLYTVASIGCALAPNLALFVAARALQGVANAFITPLLLAGLAGICAPERFGRLVGIYSSFQALGAGLGPIVGGVAADTSWRSAFWGTALISGMLALFPPNGDPRPGTQAPQIRPLLNRRMVVLGIGFLFAAAGPVGIGVLVGVVARDVLDLSGTATGLIMFGGAAAALVMGPLWGQALDRWGTRPVAVAASTSAAVATAALAMGVTPWSLAILWAAASSLAALVVVAYQALGATIAPDNRGGALSFLLSFRFVGHAVGPIVLIPLVNDSGVVAFLAAAALGLVTIGAMARHTAG